MWSPLTLAALIRSSPALLGGPDPRLRLARRLRQGYGGGAVGLYASGTHALQVALRLALRDAPSSAPIALPAFGCYDLATAAVALGRPVLLYDLDPSTLAPDLDRLEATFRRGAAAAIVAPLYGIPVPWDGVAERAAAHGVILVEDAAQALGAGWDGRPHGSFGEISVLSFGRGKGWTGGRGGALLARRGSEAGLEAMPKPAGTFPPSELAALLRLAAQWALARPHLYRLPAALPGLGLGETRYRTPSPPRAMDRTAAAVLLRTRVLAMREVRRRRHNARALAGWIAEERRGQLIRLPPAGTAGFLRLPIRLRGGHAALKQPELARRAGIHCAYPLSLAELPQLRPLLDGPAPDCPGAATLARDLITLPTHSRLDPADLRTLVDLLG